jgi:cystathionine beta-lyase/cystathionine gamma-synthase
MLPHPMPAGKPGPAAMEPYGTPDNHDRAPDGPLSQPLSRATTSASPDADTVRALGVRERHDEFYARYGHPNARAFEAELARLEGAEGAVSFASGMAAMHAVICGLVSQGERVLIAEQVYGGTVGLAAADLPRFGIEVEWFDAFDPSALRAALSRPAHLCIVETPVNPTLRIVDLAAVAAACREAGTISLVDATFAPPPIQRSLDHGVDLVLHSATKFLGGHSDVLAGVVAGPHRLLRPIEAFRARTGGILAPDPAWLLCRSAATLALRVEAQQAAALAVAEQLQAAARRGDAPIDAVHYPGLSSHPDAEVAGRQMTGGGALCSFEVRGGLDAAIRMFDSLEVVARAPSLGGVESLASLPAHSTHAGLSPEERARRGIAPGLVRVSVGLEGPDRIVGDLLQALGGCS